MATEKIYYVNQKQREVDAQVRSCTQTARGWEILLDRTVFFPLGGGQPCDLGRLGDCRVLDVYERDGEVIHLCEQPLPEGTQVHGVIDWERRFDLMQQHSGEHLLSGIVHKNFGYDNVGFHMGSDVITVDFSGELTAEQLRAVEAEVNDAIWQNIPLNIWYPDAETLPTLQYRSKKELTGAVRLVQLGTWDLCACCGTHVDATGEIGVVKLLSTTRFRNGSRVELLCGKRALQWMNVICEQNREISNLLSAKPMHTADAVRRVSGELSEAQYRLTQTENTMFAMRAEALAGQKNVLLFVEEMQPDSVRRLADAVLQRCGGQCAVFSGADGAYKYAVGAGEGDLRELAKQMNAMLNGRGGGKPGFIQGSVSASRKEIEAFFTQRFSKENLR